LHLIASSPDHCGAHVPILVRGAHVPILVRGAHVPILVRSGTVRHPSPPAPANAPRP
jgi:hypothetical protein